MKQELRARDFFVGSFNLMKTYAGTFWKIVIPVIVLNIVLGFVFARLQQSAFTNFVAADAEGGFLSNPALWFLSPWAIAALLASLLVSAALAVGWHRRTVLGEEFTWSLHALVGKNVWLYLLRFVLLFVILGLIIIIPYIVIVLLIAAIATATNSIALTVVVATPLVLALVGFVVTLFYRLGLSLPSYAIDQPIGFRAGYDATRGYGWMLLRLAVLVFLATLVITIPVAIIDFVTGPLGQFYTGGLSGDLDGGDLLADIYKPNYVSIILRSILSAVLAVYNVGLLTLLYNNFIRGDDSLQGDTSAL